MTEAEKELNEMKSFLLSAGCMSIEHISGAIRRSRNAVTKTEIRNAIKQLKHYMDILVEDFNYNFPMGEKNGKSNEQGI